MPPHQVLQLRVQLYPILAQVVVQLVRPEDLQHSCGQNQLHFKLMKNLYDTSAILLAYVVDTVHHLHASVVM